MQNIGLPKSFDTNLNTSGSAIELRRSEPPVLRKAFSDNFGETLQREKVDSLTEPSHHLQSEERPKLKNRSRLSSAFRSFRGSKSPKKKPKTAVSESVLSNGSEEFEVPPPQEKNDAKKKRNKFSKKFSLSAIKKNKVNPKQNESSLTFVTSSTQTTQTLDRKVVPSAENNRGRKVTAITTSTVDALSSDSSPTKFDKVRKIQITIQGKKIEHTSSGGNKQGKKSLPTTTTEITGGTSADVGDYLVAQEHNQHKLPLSPSKKSPKKKLKLKTKSQSPPLYASLSQITKTLEESTFIIQSAYDTPPLERAPAKPSRATALPPPPATTSTGAVRKSYTHQPPKLRRQRSHVLDSGDTTDSNFMVRGRTIGRGHRFPRPTSAEGNEESPTVINPSNPLPTAVGALESQPTTEDSTALEQPTANIRDPKKPKVVALPSTIETTSPSNSFDTDPSSSRSNEEPSSSPLTGNNIQNPNLSGSIIDRSQATDDTVSTDHPLTSNERQRINFAVGTSVQSQEASLLVSQVTLDCKDFNSLGSNKSSESGHSHISEGSSHRRKIKYIDQATIFSDEERDILDGKREALSYLSGISEYSFDSEFSGETPMPAFGDLTMDQEEPPIMTSTTEKCEHLYKILVIGELGTGKTSFIKRYVHQFFSQNYRATIGVDFALKVLHWDANTIVRLQLWDIAGQERFGNMTRVYYKEAVGAFIVFDVTRSGTFDCVSKWKEDLDSKVQLPDGSPIPCILLANKCDQEKQGVVTTPEKMDEYVKENGFAGWFETSAKENINIDEAARALVNKILLNDKLISAADIADSEKFNLANANGGQSTTQTLKSKCAC